MAASQLKAILAPVLKTIYRTILRLMTQTWLHPLFASNALKQRRRQVMLHELEAERLDRMRNPEKYPGK